MNELTAPSIQLKLLRAAVWLLPRGRSRLIRRMLPLVRPTGPVIGSFDAGRIRLSANLDEFVDQRIFFHGWFEPAVTSLFLSLVRPGFTVIDVGGNIGYFALLAASRVGASGEVIAFEPDPMCASRCEQNLGLNRFSNICLERIAVGAGRGRAQLSAISGDEPNQGGATLLRVTGDASACRTTAVDVVDLDSYCDQHEIHRVDVVKMDIEGGEGAAVQGMSKGIANRRYRKIIIEVHADVLRRSGTPPESVVEPFLRAGYKCWRVSEHGSLFHSPYVVRGRPCLVRYDPNAGVGQGMPHYFMSIDNLGE